MSPVIIPSGFTRSYLANEIGHDALHQQIVEGFKHVAQDNDFTVVEGTGHVGVGSIIDLNNARVAADLGLDMVLIGSGGLGSAIDELALNIEMCRRYNVTIRGVILNRVMDDKREMILEYIPKALKEYGIPLIGCIPFSRFLSTHSMEDFEVLFDTKMLAGEAYRHDHYRSTRLVAGSLQSYRAEEMPGELIITPASRDDIIEEVLRRYPKPADAEGQLHIGVLLTGRQKPSTAILERIRNSEIPFLYVPMCSYDVMKKITSLVSKIRRDDARKVQRAIDIVQSNIDFERLCTYEAMR
jgi:BioD-like phosphotransacetylase family protein